MLLVLLYLRPPEPEPLRVNNQTWAEAVGRHWRAVETPSNLTVDEERQWFCAEVECALGAAASEFRASARPKLRPKGSMPSTVNSDDERLSGARCGSYKERSLRKLLGRICEANHQYAAGRREPNLLRSIWCSWPSHLAWQCWESAEEVVRRALAEEVTQGNHTRLANWKHDMASEGKYATRWLKGQTVVSSTIRVLLLVPSRKVSKLWNFSGLKSGIAF